MSVRKTEDRELATQRGILGKTCVAADHAETGGADLLLLGTLRAALVDRGCRL